MDLATIQTLARRDDLLELAGGYGLLVIDECHHVPAVSFEGVVKQIPIRYMLGLTATPYRRDKLDALIAMQCGPVRHEPAPDPTPLDLELKVHGTGFAPDVPEDAPIQRVLGALAEDEVRTRQVASDVASEVKAGRRCLVLSERKAHLAALAEQLHSFGLDPLVLHGNLKHAAEQQVMDRLESSPEGPFAVVATGQYVGEGFDCPSLDTLFIAFPIAFKGKVVQYVGRVLRPFDGKRSVRVHDYLDVGVPVLVRTHDKRLKAYRSLGLDTDDQPQLTLDLG